VITKFGVHSRLLFSIFLLLLVAAVLAALRGQVETVADRERIAMRCEELSDRLKNNRNDKEALNELVKIVKGNWSFARVHAAGALGDAGPNAIPAIQDLIEAMESTDLALKAESIIAVGKVSKGSPIGVDPLIRKLNDGWHKASLAAEALATIGAPAEKAIEPLRKLANESDNSTVIWSANEAIEKIRAAVKKKAEKRE
jgi:HEAT repeat protein